MAKHWSGSPNLPGYQRDPSGGKPAPRTPVISSGNAKNGTKAKPANRPGKGFPGLGKPSRGSTVR